MLYRHISLAALAPVALAASSAGCGKAPDVTPGQSKEFDIQSSGGDRTYIVHLPKGYDSSKPAPLILSFHGNNRNSSEQEQLSQFDDETWNPYGISVYPQGVDDHWEGAPYADKGVSDKTFVGDLLDKLEATYCIDTDRVYAAGKSNGGGFVNTMACSPTVSKRFAAYAPVSGAFYTGNDNDTCHPAYKITPILEFHGLADNTISYNGGERQGVILPNILDFMQQWADKNGCGKAPTLDPLFDGNVKHYTWDCNGANTQHYAIVGLAHDWPSTKPNDDNPHNSTYIDATPIIMDFFNQHSLSSSGAGPVCS